jgi:cystathionine beta-lyase family protein involved in aluminum resistance
MEVASANEGMTAAALDLGTEVFGEMTGAALALGQEMFKGTILADVAGQALSGVLTIAKDFPFMGPIVSVLNELKGMVEQYQDAEEECKRLVVWCVALNPEP